MKYSAPRSGREATPHWTAAREGRLLLPFCAEHSHFCWPPAERCRTCRSPIAWRESKGPAKSFVLGPMAVCRAP